MDLVHRFAVNMLRPGRMAQGTPEADWQEFAGVLTALFAVRWGAWAIALVRAAFGDVPADQRRYEPQLLALTFAQSLITTLYVPFLRRRLRAAAGPRLGPRGDLIVLGLLDIAVVMVVAYFGGGFWNSYEEYVYTSLLVPAFLLDWKRAGVLIVGFVGGLFGVMALKAGTVDGPWFHGSVSRFASIILVPVLVVAVVQYLSQLSWRLREQRQQARHALAENVRLQQERAELAAAEERSRIAREIHDGIAQSIYMLSLNLEKAAELAPDDDFGRRLRGLVGLAKESLLDVRQYIFDLKPLLSGDVGLIETIRAQITEFSAVSGLQVDLRVSGDEPDLPMSHSAAAYRITQEGLANALRHAQAQHVEVDIAFSRDCLELAVRDDGRGFVVQEAAGRHGLRNMRERVEALGGRLEISSGLGEGTRITATLPLQVKA